LVLALAATSPALPYSFITASEYGKGDTLTGDYKEMYLLVRGIDT
jgi:hypothetical protein